LRRIEQRVIVETIKGGLTVTVRFDRAQGRHHQSTGKRKKRSQRLGSPSGNALPLYRPQLLSPACSLAGCGSRSVARIEVANAQEVHLPLYRRPDDGTIDGLRYPATSAPGLGAPPAHICTGTQVPTVRRRVARNGASRQPAAASRRAAPRALHWRTGSVGILSDDVRARWLLPKQTAGCPWRHALCTSPRQSSPSAVQWHVGWYSEYSHRATSVRHRLLAGRGSVARWMSRVPPLQRRADRAPTPLVRFAGTLHLPESIFTELEKLPADAFSSIQVPARLPARPPTRARAHARTRAPWQHDAATDGEP
jgi:hypothetical protein